MLNLKRDKDTIVIWAFDTYVVAAQEAINIYKTENPDVNIEVVELSQDQLVQKFRIALASGSKKNLPDIIVEEDYNMQSYFTYYEDYFADLTNYLNKDDYMDFKIQSSMYNDKMYAVPFDSGVSVLFYRLDYLQEAGFNESDMENLTWNEFIDIATTVKAVTGKPMLPFSPEGNLEGRMILQSAGQWYYDQNGDLNIQDNEVLMDMMTTLEDLYNSPALQRVYSWDDLIASFYNNEVAGVAGGGWWAPIIASNPDEQQYGNWRMTNLPKMEGKPEYTNYSNLGGGGWLVLDKDNKDTAIDFVVSTFGKDLNLINTLINKIQLVSVRKGS